MIAADLEAIQLLAEAGLPKADAVDLVTALATVREDELAKRDRAIDVMTTRIAELLSQLSERRRSTSDLAVRALHDALASRAASIGLLQSGLRHAAELLEPHHARAAATLRQMAGGG